jgi:phosphate-selective porin OprO/OprP
VKATDTGVVLGSADGAFELRPRVVFQGDARLFVDDDHKLTDQFLFRRARLYLEGKASKVITFRLMPDFAEGKVVLYDAWVDFRAVDALRLRIGKAKPPFALERLQNDSAILLGERGYPTALAPNRDIGAELHGDLFGGVLGYSVGVFNGVPDNGLSDGDQDDSKELAARLELGPFARADVKALSGLRLGVAHTRGEKSGTAAATYLAPYKSFGQNTFFSFATDAAGPNGAPTAAGTTVAAGLHARYTAHAYWPVGPVGLLGEVVLDDMRVARGGQSLLLEHFGWNGTASFVVTGENAAFDGVVPKQKLDIGEGHFGALEVVVRATGLHVDHEAFPFFADGQKSARVARELAAGLDWFPTRELKLVADFAHTTFDGGAPKNAFRDAENLFLLRTQFAY